MPAVTAILAALVALPLAAPAQQAELPRVILQSGFEDGLRGWHTQGEADFLVAREQAKAGDACARITVAPGAKLTWQQLYYTFGPVDPGDGFEVSFWVRTAGIAAEDGTGAYGALQFLNDANERVGIAHSKVSIGNGSTGWEKLTIHGTANDATRKARVDLILNSHGAAWFDEVSIVHTDTQQPWPDLGDAPRTVTVHADRVTQDSFAGVGFHVFDHVFPVSQEILETVVAKRWRELQATFARMNHAWNWDAQQVEYIARYLQRFKQETQTEVYMATWGPQDATTDEARREYAKLVADTLQVFTDRGADNLKWFCLTNELSLGDWGVLRDDLPKFKAYHQALYDEFRARGLNIGLLATDAAPAIYWGTIEWAVEHMDEITAVYGGHDYFNDRPPDDPRFYEWFEGRLRPVVAAARGVGKDFILGEFGARQDGRTIDGQRQDRCVWFETPTEPLVALQLTDAVIACLNTGVYALAYWTYMDFPDYNKAYCNRWGLFRHGEHGFSTRDLYYGYGLLSRFFGGPATAVAVETDDPWLRAGAVRRHSDGAWSVVVLNRYEAQVPVKLALDVPDGTVLRKYVYDPEHVPQNACGDLQGPEGTVTVRGGQIEDRIGHNCIAVYTMQYDDSPPAPVQGLTVGTEADATVLRWSANAEKDLCYYRVYASEEGEPSITVENQLASTIATEYRDTRPADARRKYRVIAVDRSGNAGET